MNNPCLDCVHNEVCRYKENVLVTIDRICNNGSAPVLPTVLSIEFKCSEMVFKPYSGKVNNFYYRKDEV